MDVLEGTRARARGLFVFPLVAGIIAVALAGTAHAAPATKYQSSKVVYSTPAQVAAVNAKLAARAKTAQSTTTLSVSKGCDQVALWQSITDPQIKAFMDTSGGFGGDYDRFATRRSATWLKCDLDMRTVNHYPVYAGITTVEVAGTDAQITGWAITYRAVR